MRFTEEKLEKQLAELRRCIHRDRIEIPEFRYIEKDVPEAFSRVFDDSNWPSFRLMDYWGGHDKIAWFRASVDVPLNWRDKKLALRFLCGPRDGGDSTAEALLYVNGEPLQGIDIWHEEAVLPKELLEDSNLQVSLRVWSGVLGVPDRRRFKEAELVWIDENMESYYFLAYTLLQAVRVLDQNDLRRTQLLSVLNTSYNTISMYKPKSQDFYLSVKDALTYLTAELKKLEAIKEIKPTITCVGHSHIDMAWLWRLQHSREKASRTFSTVLNLMRQFPEYRFMHSSPQLYKFLKTDYPQIFQHVKDAISSGSWEITGGMWVEPDTNVPSGESLVRQIILGKRFMKEEFDQDTNVLWLPDVFGYSWALPQLLIKSGIKYFMTTKISWNQYNRFPHDTFNWRGIDGTEILAHFITTPEEGSSRSYTYNGVIEPRAVKGIWDSYRQKDVNDELLLAYGWGDGGGGPTKEMLEASRALKNIPGIPRVQLGKVEPFFDRLSKRLEEQTLPVWDGELYLEYHRGTYTSQAFIKRENRQAEVLYHNAELYAALADILGNRENYPFRELTEGWEKLLLEQFHDILPGSSIRQVYEDSREHFSAIRAIGGSALTDALKAISEGIAVSSPSLVIFNPLGFQRHDLLEVPLTPELTENMTILDQDGTPCAKQLIQESGTKKLLLEVPEVPALGYNTFTLGEEHQAQDKAEPMIISPSRMENDHYQISLNSQGQITSLYDKDAGREVVAPGQIANVFQAFEDRPMNFDAWDIDLYYQEKMEIISNLVDVQVEETGPLRGVLRLQRQFSDSLITQHITLYKNSRRIDFKTEIDWQEKQVLLKVAFPVDIRSTKATYDIQFGNIERPTHWNTSWDWARFESVAHKWVDLSEGNYGVALLNDCKYGHDVKDNILRLTLLKSAVRPDETADRGKHVFTYSLLPHLGPWQQSSLIEEGYKLNNPLLSEYVETNPVGSLPACYEFAGVDNDNIVIETVKRAEDGNGWIIRLYETKQMRCPNVCLKLGSPIKSVWECNLVEEDQMEIQYQKNSFQFAINPFEIKTFRVCL